MNLGEINQAMSELNDWSLEVNAIVKNFTFENFKQSLDFVNKVGEIAEKMNHHPYIIIKYSVVKLILMTHSVNGLTKIDFDVAKEIDKLG